MRPYPRSARFGRVARKLSADVTDAVLVAAPQGGSRIVVDDLHYSTNNSGSVEFKQVAGAWADATGLLGHTFDVNGGLIIETNLECDPNMPLLWTTVTTGLAVLVAYLTIVYHLED